MLLGAKPRGHPVKPTLSFDASGINRLIDSRITRPPARRAQLLDVSKALMRNADVILPFQELLRSQILAVEACRGYDWRTIAIEAPEYRREIALREILTDALSEEQQIRGGLTCLAIFTLHQPLIVQKSQN